MSILYDIALIITTFTLGFIGGSVTVLVYMKDKEDENK